MGTALIANRDFENSRHNPARRGAGATHPPFRVDQLWTLQPLEDRHLRARLFAMTHCGKRWTDPTDWVQMHPKAELFTLR
jgi:hypothetical protein